MPDSWTMFYTEDNTSNLIDLVYETTKPHQNEPNQGNLSTFGQHDWVIWNWHWKDSFPMEITIYTYTSLNGEILAEKVILMTV